MRFDKRARSRAVRKQVPPPPAPAVRPIRTGCLHEIVQARRQLRQAQVATCC